MPQTNYIDVEVNPAGQTDIEPLEFKGVHYISYISSPGGSGEGTYGIPAIISEEKFKRLGLPLRVLYVNPHNVVAMLAERKT